MSAEQWTPEELADAGRTAAAMFLAGYRYDPTAVAELWNGAPNKPALVCGRILTRLATIEDDQEEDE